eukprot:m.33998 g.33998  ORF g.33998 m.33998 type:complete len:367 (+) comp15360_c0_seq1:477-1577(+)
MVSRRIVVALVSVLLTGVVALDEPKFDGKIRTESDGSSSAYMIPPYKSNHASTIEQLPDGTLVAAWFSGEKEEASDCAIVFASLPRGSDQWSKAATLSIRDKYSNQNPVLFYDNTTSILHLFHSQAPAESGESQSAIWHLQSEDKGKTWTKPAPFLTAPGAFPRNRIIRGLDGGVIFPIYNASGASSAFDHQNYAIIDRSNPSMSDWSYAPIKDSAYLVQPSVIRLPNKTLRVFFRDRRAKNIYAADSTDDGHTWTKPVATSLPNNNAGIESNILSSHEVVIVYNPTTSGRNPLAIALSKDYGLTWVEHRDVQNGDSNNVKKSLEFSYPSVLQTPDGNIHVTYTYNRDTIKYKRFPVSWIGQKEQK